MLKKKFMYEIKRPRKDKKLPVVLSKEEVAKILSSIDNIKHKAILMIIYSAGLRVGEVVKLKVEDVDSKLASCTALRLRGMLGSAVVALNHHLGKGDAAPPFEPSIRFPH